MWNMWRKTKILQKCENLPLYWNNEKWKEGKRLQYITNLDKNKLGVYKNQLITEEVVLTDERLYDHILLYHESEYKQLRPHIRKIIQEPDYIVEDKQKNMESNNKK